MELIGRDIHRNPILIDDQSWEGTGVYYAECIQKNNQYVMIFMNAAGTGFGKATSTDANKLGEG